MLASSAPKSLLIASTAAIALSACGFLDRSNRGGGIEDLPLPTVAEPLITPSAPVTPAAPQPSLGGLSGNRAAIVNNLLRQGPVGPYSIGLPYTFENVRYVPREDLSYRESGLASWYGPGLAGSPTSNGENFNPQAHTAAHKTLPFSSIVKVTNPANGRSTLVRINDRGPFLPDHIIDLSQRAAQDLGLFTSQGSQVSLELLEQETRAVAEATGGSIGLQPPVTTSLPTGVSTFQPQPVNNLPAIQPIQATVTPTPDPLPLPSSAITTTNLPPLPAAPTTSITTPLPSPVQPIVQAPAIPQTPSLPPLPPQPLATQPIPQPSFQPAPLPAPTQTAAASPAGSASGYYVQAGSYSSRENAEQVRNKLTGVGNVVIFPVSVSGKQMYRVRVGPYNTRQQAQAQLGTVIISGGPDAIVVKEG